MKKKFSTVITLLALSLMTLTACSVNTNKEQPTTVPTVVPTTETTVTPTEEPTSTPTATPSVAPQTSESLSDKYVDFDDMSILVNGIKYTLNVSTLQDMIDNGVPFVDTSNANNNIRPNYESETFEIKVDDEHLVYVSFSNFTDENKTINECPLSYVKFDVVDNDVVELSCPLDLKEDDLVMQAGEPTNVDYKDEVMDDGAGNDYVEKTNTYSYTQLSEKYLGDHGYYFVFKNGELYNYTITYR